jgi:hypothetical protein
LGKGAFSNVYTGYHEDWPNEPYAIKEISNQVLYSKLGERGKEGLDREFRIC